MFRYNRGPKVEIKNFNSLTVWDILTKKDKEPPKKSRICEPDWLPWKSDEFRKREAEKEQF
jgi:hypothetical protein